MDMKIRALMAVFVVASVVLMGAAGSVRAADEWFVLSEQALNAANPSVEIKSEVVDGRRTSSRSSSPSRAVMWRSRKPSSTGTIAPTTRSRMRVLKAAGNCSEECSGTQGAPHGGDGQYKILGDARHGQGLGIRLSRRSCRAEPRSPSIFLVRRYGFQ